MVSDKLGAIHSSSKRSIRYDSDMVAPFSDGSTGDWLHCAKATCAPEPLRVLHFGDWGRYSGCFKFL